MIIDAHLHCTGRERVDDVLRALDDARIDVAVLLAPFLNEGHSLDDAASLRRANAHLARLVQRHRDRLIGFAVVDPRDAAAAHDLRVAIEDLGLAGVKMVPTGWYPDEPRVQPVFALASELRLPVLFHSGIFIDGRSGRFCRPAFFEVMRDHPGARVALAHLGWPWTDEAIAVALIDRIHGVPPERCAFRLDISFGPPPPYRREVLARALEVLGAGLLQFGSDCFLPCSGRDLATRVGWVHELCEQIGVDAVARERIWSGTAAAWLGSGLPPSARAQPPAPRQREAQADVIVHGNTEGGLGGWLGASPSMMRWCC
jgi:predicted TIM-barrel fold metal-dependent hydrolase